jgi:hypothetical protein
VPEQAGERLLAGLATVASTRRGALSVLVPPELMAFAPVDQGHPAAVPATLDGLVLRQAVVRLGKPKST